MADSDKFSSAERAVGLSGNAARVWRRRMLEARILATSASRSSGVREDESSVGRMGRLLLELPTTTFDWRPARCLADNTVNSLDLLTYPVGWQNDEASVVFPVYSLNDLRKHQRIPKGMLEHSQNEYTR